MAGTRGVEATESHQGADGTFRFAQGHESSAKITKSELGLPNVSRSPIVLANLLGTDRRFPRHWQRDVSEGEQPLEGLLSKLKDSLDRLAKQFDGDLTEKEHGRNHYQEDIPLHVAPQSVRRFFSAALQLRRVR